MLSNRQDDPAPCLFMARLIDLLGEMPSSRNQRRAVAVAESLDRLDGEARRHEASEMTLAAIKGARVLLALAELPATPLITRTCTKGQSPRAS